MTISEDDRLLLNNEILKEDGVPKDCKWILRYFTGEENRPFAIYFLKMRSKLAVYGINRIIYNFTDHTGIFAHLEKMKKWYRTIIKLEEKAAEALANKNLTYLAEIKLGNILTLNRRFKKQR